MKMVMRLLPGTVTVIVQGRQTKTHMGNEFSFQTAENITFDRDGNLKFIWASKQ